MKLGIIGYLPPPLEKLNPVAFLQNFLKYSPGDDVDVLLYSDHDWDLPNLIKLKAKPEAVIPADPRFSNDGRQNTFALNNILFLTGLLVGISKGVTHFIYLESDCRVGRENWASIIFEEYFRHPMPTVCGGSPVCYNPCNTSQSAARRWMEFVNKYNTKRNFPIPTYGFKSAANGDGSAVFVNGALGVYEMAWMKQFFPNLERTPQLACDMFAWDFTIGFEMWKHFGERSYEMVAYLESVFSSYGDVLTTEQERLDMLRTGKAVAVHQVKSNAQP